MRFMSALTDSVNTSPHHKEPKMFTTNKLSKIAVTTATLILAVSLTACGNSAEPIPSATDSPSPMAPVEPTVEPTVAPEPTVEPNPEDMPSEPEDMFNVTGLDAIAEVYGNDLAASFLDSGYEVASLSWVGGGLRDLHKPHSRAQVVEAAEWFQDLMTGEAYDRLVSYVNSDDTAEYSKALALIPTVEPEDGRVTEVNGVSYYVDADRTATLRFTPSGEVVAGVADETDLATYTQDVLVTAYVQDGKVVSIPLTLTLSFAPGATDTTPWLLENWWLASNGTASVQDAS